MKPQPIVFIWKELTICDEDGSLTPIRAMVPIPRYTRVAAAQFKLDGEHVLAILENRNMKFHNGYFAAIHEGWSNLPEQLAPKFPSDEHLRHWLLMETDQFDLKEIEYETARDADRCARYIRTESPYARIKVEKRQGEEGRTAHVVIVKRASSQALGAMDGREFSESGTKVLELLAAMIGVTVGDLIKRAKQA